MTVILFLLPLCLSVHLRDLRSNNIESTASKLPKGYHTSDDLSVALRSMVDSCKAEMRIEQDLDVEIVTLGREDVKDVKKVFLLFGEHARELVSVETAFDLIQEICGNSHLEGVVFKIIPNANAKSRRLVEQGEFCRRVDIDGVDLNRNWGVSETRSDRVKGKTYFSLSEDAEQTNPGPYPFSETETRVIKESLQKFNPDLFISVHSGVRGIYTPWADSQTEETTSDVSNFKRMKDLVDSVDKEHCQCPLGEAGVTIGYSSSGTCIDWAYSNLKTKWVYAFEIYQGDQSTDDCFSLFNPTSDLLSKVTSNWTNAILHLVDLM